MQCPICTKEIKINLSQEDYNYYLNENIKITSCHCQGCNSEVVIIEYRGIQFYCSSKGVVKLLNQSENTQIRYVMRSNIYNTTIYYDLICIYNIEENWIRTIPVPIFVKLFAPYLDDRTIEHELRELKDMEEASNYDRDVIDFWGSHLALENIEFLRLFIINMEHQYSSMEEVPDDFTTNDCFITDNDWKDLKFKFKKDTLTLQATIFKPVLDKLGFEFYSDEDINHYHHGIYSMLSCEVYEDDDYGYKYDWYPTIAEIEAGYNENPDDFRQEPRWGYNGCYAFSCRYANYEKQNEGCSTDYNDLLSYIKNVLFYLNPSELENDSKKINSSFPNETVTINIYVDIYSDKIKWYRKKKLTWNQQIFNDIYRTFKICEEKYEKLLADR